MKFIRKEYIVTTIFNKELSDIDVIRGIFDNLCSHEIDFSIIIKKFLPYQQDHFNINFEKARVKKVYEDDTFDMLAFKKGIKTVMKKVLFSDVVEILAITHKHKILDVDDALTRWEILDL
jgi:hypothetical protein